jgi:acetyl-CoA carboxylase carboxyl transferase subunit beta
MSWLTNYVRPRIRALYAGSSEKPEVPENLWHQCPSCERMIFHRDLEQNQRVCPHCAFHMRVGPEHRFRALFDEGSWTRVELPKAPVDPLRFRDQKKYVDRLKEAQGRTKAPDALDAARGTIDGLPVVVAVMNFEFMAGSMGAGLGEGFVTAALEAVKHRAAFVVVTASGGARMQEGAISLMQMAKTTIAVEEVKEAGLPYVVVLTDPTTGGVTASFAMLGDVHLAEPGAVIGFAGTRVIEQTIREKLPAGFQRAEYLLAHGMVDQVVHRFKLRETLARLLDLLLRPDRATQALVVTEPRPEPRVELPTAAAAEEPAPEPADHDEQPR